MCLIPSFSSGEGRRTPIIDAVEKVLPSVVNISTKRLVNVMQNDSYRRLRRNVFDQFFSDLFVPPPTPQSYPLKHSLGSGVIVDTNGYILSNYHVIERAAEISVTLENGEMYEARIVASDEINDLALIKIDVPGGVKAIDFAEDDDLLLGEQVVVLGNPFGLGHTVTVGVLSAKNREALYQGEVLYHDILQTDAAVNPGSSGGPLVNVNGELIGINVAFNKEAQNIGFAVPTKRVRELVNRWFAPKTIKKIRTDFESEEQNGVLKITSINEEHIPSNLDIRVNDTIVSLNGERVHSLLDYNRYFLGVEIADRLDLEVEREGRGHWVSLEVVSLSPLSSEEKAERLLGVQFEQEVETLSQLLRFNRGLPLVSIEKGGPAERARLKPGMYISRINDFEIQSLDDVGLALEDVEHGDTVRLLITQLRETESFIVAQLKRVSLTAR